MRRQRDPVPALPKLLPFGYGFGIGRHDGPEPHLARLARNGEPFGLFLRHFDEHGIAPPAQDESLHVDRPRNTLGILGDELDPCAGRGPGRPIVQHHDDGIPSLRKRQDFFGAGRTGKTEKAHKKDAGKSRKHARGNPFSFQIGAHVAAP